MEFLIALALVVLVAAFVTVPLRRRAQEGQGEGAESERAELEAVKAIRYREIRDAEADHAAGKLSDEDFALLDAELRREAVEILDRANGNGAVKEEARSPNRPAERV